MIIQKEFSIGPLSRGFHAVTQEVLDEIGELPKIGLLNLHILHTSAALTINESDDPTVLEDFEAIFNKLVPENMPFLKHTIEGPDDMPAHIKAAMIGSTVTIPITNHKLNLGIWQGIYFCEFRTGGRKRNIIATIYH